MTKSKSLETCLTLTLALVIAFLWKQAFLLLYLAIAIGLIGLFIPILANAIHRAWYLLATILGAITSRLLLALVFFLLLSPIAFLYRLFNKGSILSKPKNNSYWISRNHQFQAKDLKEPW